MNQVGIGKAFGTFGELLQGVLPTERHFLVTLPIQLHSNVEWVTGKQWMELTVTPHHKHKSLALARQLLSYWQLPLQGRLVLHSNIPEGKGMASSSADLVATARAIAHAYQRHLPMALLETLMAEIEPSDGVMYNG